MPPPAARDLDPYLEHLRELPFVRTLRLAASPVRGTGRPDARLTLKTAKRTFTFVLDVKRTFLDRALTNASAVTVLQPEQADALRTLQNACRELGVDHHRR